jgi:hypothetical protein
MLLGNRNITANDLRRYEINYSDFLTGAGATGQLKLPVVTIQNTAGVLSTVKSYSISTDGLRLYFYIQAGPNVNEVFTVAVQVQDSQGEIINDTVSFSVVSP